MKLRWWVVVLAVVVLLFCWIFACWVVGRFWEIVDWWGGGGASRGGENGVCGGCEGFWLRWHGGLRYRVEEVDDDEVLMMVVVVIWSLCLWKEGGGGSGVGMVLEWFCTGWCWILGAGALVLWSFRKKKKGFWIAAVVWRGGVLWSGCACVVGWGFSWRQRGRRWRGGAGMGALGGLVSFGRSDVI